MAPVLSERAPVWSDKAPVWSDRAPVWLDDVDQTPSQNIFNRSSLFNPNRPPTIPSHPNHHQPFPNQPQSSRMITIEYQGWSMMSRDDRVSWGDLGRSEMIGDDWEMNGDGWVMIRDDETPSIHSELWMNNPHHFCIIIPNPPPNHPHSSPNHPRSSPSAPNHPKTPRSSLLIIHHP